MKLQGKRIAILAENMYQEMELWVPYYRFKEEGADMKIVGAGGARSYASKHGYPVTVDVQAEQLSSVEYDAVVIPGGFAPDALRRSDEGLDLVREFDAAGKPIAFICHAGWVPISAGIVEGRRVTSVPAIADDLRNAGAEWEDSEVVVDGNLVSSRRPPDLPAFMRALIAVAVEASEPVAAS